MKKVKKRERGGNEVRENKKGGEKVQVRKGNGNAGGENGGKRERKR